MFSTKRTSALTTKTLLSGIAGISLVLGMSLAPVSFDFQNGQLGFKSIAAYASPGDNERDNEKPAASESSNEKPAASNAAEKAREQADKAREAEKARIEKARELADKAQAAEKDRNEKAREQANKARAAEKARELADKARELADKANTAEKASELANKARELADKAGQEKDNGNDTGNVNPDVAPLALSEFISSMRKGTSVTSGGATATSLNLSYSNGWKEKIVNNRYVLVDPNGNTIISRAVRTADIARLRSILK